MTCIAGTVDAPLHWIRFAAGEPIELDGRWCDRTEDFTSRRTCSSCPAYRGLRYDSSPATGVAPNGDPLGLRPEEYEAWLAAVDATYDDDFKMLAIWQDRMAGGIGQRTLARIGEPAALEAEAARVASWRALNQERARELNRAHARAYRARKRVSNPPQAAAKVRV